MLIVQYFVNSIIAGLGPLILYYGVGTAIVVGCIAWAYFMPVFKKTALWVALAVVMGLISYTAGVKDEANRWKAKEANVSNISKKAVTAANKRIKSDTPSRVRDDKYNRDR